MRTDAKTVDLMPTSATTMFNFHQVKSEHVKEMKQKRQKRVQIISWEFFDVVLCGGHQLRIEVIILPEADLPRGGGTDYSALLLTLCLVPFSPSHFFQKWIFHPRRSIERNPADLEIKSSGKRSQCESEKPTRMNFCLKREGNIFSIFMSSYQSPSTAAGWERNSQTVQARRWGSLAEATPPMCAHTYYTKETAEEGPAQERPRAAGQHWD